MSLTLFLKQTEKLIISLSSLLAQSSQCSQSIAVDGRRWSNQTVQAARRYVARRLRLMTQ